MKVAVCSAGDSLDSLLDNKFGRCNYFLVVETLTFEAIAHKNPAADIVQGSSRQAVAFLKSLGVSAVIGCGLTPYVGKVIANEGIEAYICPPDIVRYAINYFNAGSLQKLCCPRYLAADNRSSGIQPGIKQARRHYISRKTGATQS